MENKILIFGDICPINNYRKLYDKGEMVFSDDILKKIQKGRYAIANLEGPATDCKTSIVKCGPSLKLQPEDLKVIKHIGFNVLSLANNHILDYQEQGVLDTIAGCENYGIKTVGAGLNLDKAAEPIILSMGKKKVGIMSFAEKEFNLAKEDAPGANHFDIFESFFMISKLKETVDYLIILYHGGVEYYVYPSPLLQKKCRKMIESGADLVLCQHSHCIGTIENYLGGTILYGQGNSLFDYQPGVKSWNEGLVVEINADNFNKLKFHLICAEKEGVVLADTEVTKKRIDLMHEQSKVLYDSQKLEAEWKKFVLSKQALYYPLLYGKGRIFNKINRILKNKIITMLIGKKAQMITLNLVRCESHQEVVLTMLEDKIYG